MTSESLASCSACSKRKSSPVNLAGFRLGIALAATFLFATNANAAKGDKVFYQAAPLGSNSRIMQYDSATGLNTLLTPNLPSYTDLEFFVADSKGMNVYYTGDIWEDHVVDLHRIDIKSSSSARISLPFSNGGNVEPDFKLDVKGANIFYRATPFQGSTELYRYTVKTGATVKVNPTLAGGRDIVDFAVHPKGTSAFYISDMDTNDKFELYMSVAQEGASAVKLSEELGDGRDVISFIVNAKGTAVAYLADKDTDNHPELYYVDLKSKAVKKLNLELTEGGSVLEYGFDPKGKSVIYIADQEVNDKRELYRVDLKTGAVKKLNPELPEDSDVIEFKLDSKGANVYYLADQVTDEIDELFQVNLKTLANVKLNIPLVENGDVQQFGLDSKGTAVFYVADQDVNDITELYRYDLKSGSIRKISDPEVPNQFIVGADVNAKGTGLAYYASRNWLNTDLTYFDLATGRRIQIDGLLDFVLFFKLLGGQQFMGNPFAF